MKKIIRKSDEAAKQHVNQQVYFETIYKVKMSIQRRLEDIVFGIAGRVLLAARGQGRASRR